MDIFQNIITAFSRLTKYNLYHTFVNLFGAIEVTENVFNPIMMLCNILIGITVLFLHKKFFIQSAKCAERDKLGVLQGGLIIYGAFFGLIVLYLMSIVGYGIGIFILFIFFVFIEMGQIALAIAIGNAITKGRNIYFDMLFGYAIIELFKLIPYIGWLVAAFVVPLLSVGIVAQVVKNLFFDKKYYDSVYEGRNVTLDKSKICDIIIHSDNREEN